MIPTRINENNVNLFDSMYEYLSMYCSDMTHYSKTDFNRQENAFVEPVKVYEDSEFMIKIDDEIEHEGINYVRVNFGEDEVERNYLAESALDDEIYIIYRKQIQGLYYASNRFYATYEEARNNL